MSKVQRRRRQGEKKTVSDGEQGSNSEKVMEVPSATASSKADHSNRSSDVDSPHSQPATTDGKSTPTKTNSTPTRSSKSMFEFYNKHHGKGVGKGQARKQAGSPSARSEADKSSTPQFAPAKVHGDTQDTFVTESDGSVAVIDYSALEESETHAAGSPKRENHKFERRNRRGRWKDEHHPNGSDGSFHKEKPAFVPRGGKAHTSRRPSSRQFDRQATTPTKQNDSQTHVSQQEEKAVDTTNEIVLPSTPSPEYFHRGGYRGRSRGDPSFQRGRGGYGRRSFRGGYRGNSRPGYIPSSQGTEPLDKQDEVDQLAESVSNASLASPPDHATKQEEVTTDETKQARLEAHIEAKRQLKREKNKKRRLAKQLSMRAGEHQSDNKESVPEEICKAESEPAETTPSAVAVKPKKVNKSKKSKFQSEKQTSKAAAETTTDEIEPSPDSKSVPSSTAHVQGEVSSSKHEPTVSDIDEKPKRHRKVNRDNSSLTTVPQPFAITNQQAPKLPTMDDNLENQHNDTPTADSGHHRPNQKRYPSRQEDSASVSHAQHDSVPMPQQHIPASVPTPSFMSQPVAFALASPNGGPIPVYTMPFQAMNPAMGDVQGGRQGMFYGPMMGSPAAAVSTSSSAPVPQPTMIDPNMMYMPYDSQQMLMYNPYWYQAMAQQAIPPPNQVWNAANGGQPVDYNNWKQAGHERPHNDSNYHTTTAPGIAYNQHGEQMAYSNDNNNGPQAVYYYPVSY
ncbi:hypothetical protein INT43_007064 [Umbelopsis isabellina]|uniref:Btz domain-containing protein n=1 Tax=Mortierella isabellina TaxID=91625 RepID=A0A8H7UHQ0_MORIS|nr:hypothetical protein INT43_007064 [Umbelopsis isabellina]